VLEASRVDPLCLCVGLLRGQFREESHEDCEGWIEGDGQSADPGFMSAIMALAGDVALPPA
jgi:hypothetical protein